MVRESKPADGHAPFYDESRAGARSARATCFAASALLDALERLAVGYNAYHLRDKTAHYGRAREAACAAASALLVLGDLAADAERASRPRP